MTADWPHVAAGTATYGRLTNRLTTPAAAHRGGREVIGHACNRLELNPNPPPPPPPDPLPGPWGPKHTPGRAT